MIKTYSKIKFKTKSQKKLYNQIFFLYKIKIK